MTRFVFEAKDSEKIALSSVLEPVGKTFTDWFEENLSETISYSSDLIDWQLNELKDISTLEDTKKSVEDVLNANWSYTDSETGFLTHGLHPYPAKFIPQLPANFIRRFSLPGEIILDPFGGSGTTALEAIRMGRRAISLDANPLATLIGKVKSAQLNDDDKRRLERLRATIDAFSFPADATIDSLKLNDWIPSIPNIQKWFQNNVIIELAYIRMLIDKTTTSISRDVALASLSKIIVRVSNQDSETRYVSKEKNISDNFCVRLFSDSLSTTIKKIDQLATLKGIEKSAYFTIDSRKIPGDLIPGESVSFIVTSPPYPNATDYHLYHRFRLFWLGYDPKTLGDVEIGSHLKHQRKRSGIEEYISDMSSVLRNCFQLLIPGRYAAFIVGDAIFDGKRYDTAANLTLAAESIGFKHTATITRDIHSQKRSFSKPAQRARKEKIVLLYKQNTNQNYYLIPPQYKLYEYEKRLSSLEIEKILRLDNALDFLNKNKLTAKISGLNSSRLKRLTFTHFYENDFGLREETWQKLLENGDAAAATRKDPKYVTHGIHAYKGKFYPQLAKSLLNISGLELGSKVLDPFCGSGTVLLESYMNGFKAFGCDMNPLAAKISKAKLETLTIPKKSLFGAITSIEHALLVDNIHAPNSLEQFSEDLHADLFSWFPKRVLYKLNWLLSQIRLFSDIRLVNFFEVVLSDCIRDISQQEPSDLRIRRRAIPIEDAPVFEIFSRKLSYQKSRIEDFYSINSSAAHEFIEPTIFYGDNRKEETFIEAGINRQSIDAVVTSPPYATALPYIDTDRLSLLAIMNIPGKIRKNLEESLTGSREISNKCKKQFEDVLFDEKNNNVLPKLLTQELHHIYKENVKTKAGFRRLNMPALLFRYFIDMRANLNNIMNVLKSGASAYYVVGDSKTRLNDDWIPIRTTHWLLAIASELGFHSEKMLEISVTTENMKHIRHAITENTILKFTKE